MREDAFAITPLAAGKLERIAVFEQRYAVTETPGGEPAETVVAQHFILLERMVHDREWRVCKTPDQGGARSAADTIRSPIEVARSPADHTGSQPTADKP